MQKLTESKLYLKLFNRHEKTTRKGKEINTTSARRLLSSLPAEELNNLSISSKETPVVSGTAKRAQTAAEKHPIANRKYVPLNCH
jgi:hypothetical protein